MMKNRKMIKKNKINGFTLVELVGVIILVGIIVLIAVTTVNHIIEEAKKDTFEANVESLVNVINQNCKLEQINDQEITRYYVFEDGEQLFELDIEGDKPTNGSVVVDNRCRITSVVLNKDKYIAVISEDGTDIEVREEKYYIPGTKVTYNPGDSTYSTWHVLKDNGDTVTLFLNRNIGSGKDYVFEWVSAQDYKEAGGTGWVSTNLGPLTAMKGLKNNTSTWNAEAKENIRLITLEDILEVLGVNEWDGEKLYFDTKSNVEPTLSGVSKYAWLFNNTGSCLENGCEEEAYSFDTTFYWTGTSGTDNYAYTIDQFGSVGEMAIREVVYNDDGTSGWRGWFTYLRPVITIPKTSIQ